MFSIWSDWENKLCFQTQAGRLQMRRAMVSVVWPVWQRNHKSDRNWWRHPHPGLGLTEEEGRGCRNREGSQLLTLPLRLPPGPLGRSLCFSDPWVLTYKMQVIIRFLSLPLS